MTLEDVYTKAINGGTPSTEVEKYWKGDIPLIAGADIVNQKVSKIRRYITEEAVKNTSTNVIHKGNLLVVTSTGVGKLAITPFDVAVSQDFTGIIPNEKIETEFLFWLLNNSANYFLDRTQGASINGITRNYLMRFVFPLPPLPEQRHISTIDSAIEQTEAIIAKQQRIKTGLMQDLLARGIDEHGNIRSEETHEFRDSPLGGIPVEWEVQPCIALCREIVVGIVIRPVQYYRLDGVPVLRSANVKENKINSEALVFMAEKDNEKLSKSRLRKGDLVTVRTGYPGTTGVIPPELDGSNCVDIVISRPNHEKIRSEFLSIWINSDHGKRQVIEGQGGLAQQHFNVGEMRTLLVMVPDINEQEIIENLLILQSSAIDELAENQQKLRSTKTALMQDLLTGKKRVTALLNDTEEITS